MEEPRRKRILLADDNVTNLLFAKSALSGLHDVLTAPSAAKMFAVLRDVVPDLILLDADAPELGGPGALMELRGDPRLGGVPVILLTSQSGPESEAEGLALGAADFIHKPFEPSLLRSRVALHLKVEEQRRLLERQKKELQSLTENLSGIVAEKTRLADELQGAVLAAVADLAGGRGSFAANRAERTRRWLEILLDPLAASGALRDEMRGWDIPLALRASQLYDVGKITVPDAILFKKGPLTPEEFEAARSHAALGARIIEGIAAKTAEREFLGHALAFAAAHHERWDGTGYPEGLSGKGIPLQGRLMAIADVYDALTSERPYKRAFPHEYAAEIIVSGRGSSFDPVLVDAFKTVQHKFVK
jgi:putative two-component system response regulator